MSWGSGPWGSTPWGGGDPSSGGFVVIDSVDYITPTYIRLNLNTGVIVNDRYLDPENYTVTLREDSPLAGVEVEIVRVITPAQDALAVDYVYLQTTPHTNGATYTVSFFALTTLDGVDGFNGGAGNYSSRVTKTMTALKSLPAHFDKRVDSLLHSVVAAISMSDDQIGGSQNDEFA